MTDVTLLELHFDGGLNVGGGSLRGSKSGDSAIGGGGLGRIAAVVAVLVVLGALVAIKRRREEPPEELLDAD